MTLNNLEPFQKMVLVNFFAQFCAATRICTKMAGDRPRQPVYEIFGMECRF